MNEVKKPTIVPKVWGLRADRRERSSVLPEDPRRLAQWQQVEPALPREEDRNLLRPGWICQGEHSVDTQRLSDDEDGFPRRGVL